MSKTLNTLLFCLMSFMPLKAESQVYPFPYLTQTRQQISRQDSLKIEDLKIELKRKGFDINPFLNSNKFEIYNNIGNIFKTSPESKAMKRYREVLKTGNYEVAQNVFLEEYFQYKIKLGLEGKKTKIKGFVADNLEDLVRTEKEYNIEKEMIASVIGIESNFGKNTGRYYAFNSFVSLYAKDYRKDFAITELTELLKFCKKNNRDIFIKSSYAGAIGFGQFIPSSLNAYFMGDVYSMKDNINSVANYLKSNKRNGDVGMIYSYNPSLFYVMAVMELSELGKGKNPDLKLMYNQIHNFKRER